MAGMIFSDSNNDNKLPQEILQQLDILQGKIRRGADLDDHAPQPVTGAIDNKIRLAKVDLDYLAIYFELEGERRTSAESTFVYVGTYRSAEAIRRAQQLEMTYDPNLQLTAIRTVPTETAAGSSDSAAAWEGVGGQKFDAENPFDNPFAVEENPRTQLAQYSPEQLGRELSISPESFEIAHSTTTEAELDAKLAEAPTYELLAIKALINGRSIEQVKQDQALLPNTVPGAEPNTEPNTEPSATELVGGLVHPANRGQYTIVKGDTSDIGSVISGGDFQKWRVFLHPSQQEFVTKSFSGPARIKGGAGTGKTVVLIHRANHLLQRSTPAGQTPRMMLTTRTAELATAIQDQLLLLNPDAPLAESPGEPGAWIAGIDALAEWILRDATPAEITAASRNVLGFEFKGELKEFITGQDIEVWQEAIELVDEHLDAPMNSPHFMSYEYDGVILSQEVNSQEQYLAVPRKARGTQLSKAKRKVTWQIVQQFHQLCQESGHLTAPAIAAIAAEVLRARVLLGTGRLFDHGLIDEGQDLNAGHWRMLRAAVQVGKNDIFITADVHQHTSGPELVLSRFQISTRGRARELVVNYRTTRQNLKFATALLGEEEWEDLDGVDEDGKALEGYHSLRSGPQPLVQQCADFNDEVQWLAETVKAWQEEGARNSTPPQIAVFVRTTALQGKVARSLKRLGISTVQTPNAKSAAERVSVTTFSAAKGHEYTHVALVGLDAETVPNQFSLLGLTGQEREDQLRRERSLLYVGASRARDQLVVTYSGRPSTLLPEAVLKL